MSRETTLSQPLAVDPAPPRRRCIHEQFQWRAAQQPTATAVSCGDEALNYGGLNARANQLAHYLRAIGVGPEARVALYFERSPWMVVAILGVLKAGGAYVPMDLAYPKARLSYMVEDARPAVLLTQQHLKAALPPAASRVVCLDADWDIIGGGPEHSPENLVESQNAAYVIYTSGSTGNPKGVLVTHENVVRLFEQTDPWYRFNEQDVWPLFHSYAFDVSVWELWGALFHGGRLVIVPYLVTRSPGEFYDLLAREKVTVLNQTPSAFRQLIWAEESAPVKHRLDLRYVICAGEALELQSLRPWFDRHGDETPRVVNMYGITETTVHSTYRVIRQADLRRGVGSVIGVPIPDLQIHLLDDDLKPVRSGSPGEICVGGAGVARGYLNRPELTAKRFLPDPFSSRPGARLYRSGDLAQINADGELEYLGRMDHQVKIRGFRVELGEIESALNRHPAVRESVVLAQDTSQGDKRLVAYMVPVEAAPTVTEIRQHLASMLPDYMVPACCVFLKSLPLTTNGKVDRRALPNPDGVRPQLKTAYVRPRTPVEDGLARIWAEVLELDRVGVEDNFFELGGDSIRSIRVLAKAQARGWFLTLQQVFQNPTVAGLAACAEAGSGNAKELETRPFSLISAEDRAKLPAGVEDAYPVARLQMGMFFCNELDPLSAMYHDVFSYRIHAAFDREKLHAAIQRLAARHPLLRTSFHLAGYSQPLQLVHSRVEVPFTVEDLRGVPGAEQDEAVIRWVEAEKRRAFTRSTPPLFRFHAQWRAERTFQFIISFHHACLDGWSLAAVVTEIFQDYAALGEGVERRISPPRITYRDFVALEQQAIESEAGRRYWREKLQDAVVQRVPRWPKERCAGGHEQRRGPEVAVGRETLAGLRELAQAAGVPLRTVLVAAHQRVMASLSGQTDVISGLIMNGRPEAIDGERLVGLFLNTVPLRLELKGGSWLELVRQTFAAEQELLPHRRMPLSEIQKLAGGQPLLETACDFVHFHVYRQLQECRGVDLAEGHYFEANNLAIYTTFMLDLTSSRLELHLDYDPNLVGREQVEDITQYYARTLDAMAADPQARYDRFCPLSEGETHRLFFEWNATAADYPRDRCIHELFEARAAETPEALALAAGTERLTYGELNRRAEQLAGHLRRARVGPEVLVGLYVERGVDLLVGLLGILKAGGAYVPLDPSYPRERLAFMLEDAGAPVLLTEQRLLGVLPKTAARTICIDTPDRGAGATAAGNAERVRSTNLAYVIYTSGSTGTPKGVPVAHRAVVNLLTSIGRTIGFAAADNLLAVTTLAFDIAGLELFLPLVNGGRVTLATREQAGDGTQLAALLESSGASVMQGTPATWALLVESGWAGKANLRVLCGGEALRAELARQLLARAKEVWNVYGPTETTIWSAAWRVQPGEAVVIGRPLANTSFFVLGPWLQPVPVGTIGELYIGGDGLARGYLARPELTAERFIRNPFVSAPDSRLYRTGDLARYLPDGRVESLGRADHQVKVRGFRIEPGEVESVLRQHSGIADALVCAREDALGEKRLIGYIISRNGPPASDELREFMRRKLPAYMVPAQFVLLEEFPRTPNGKIDRLRLPSPETSRQPARAGQPPRSAEEGQLAEIWQEVLSVNAVSVDDDFFELGGDSLSATRAFVRMNRAFGMNLRLREMLEHPTIRSLAELVARHKGMARPETTVIPRQPRRAEPEGMVG